MPEWEERQYERQRGSSRERTSTQPNDLVERFAGLPKLDRLEVVMAAQKRQQAWERAIMPVRGIRRDPGSQTLSIRTSEQAQQAMLLESYYTVLAKTLEGQALALHTDRAPVEHKIQRLRAEAQEELLRLQPVKERGDWHALKAKWRERADEPRKPRLFRRGSDDDWFRDRDEYEARMRTYKFADTNFDLANVRRILKMVPDKTPPLDPQQMDPHPLIIPK